jgi:hypothetical protein
MGLGLIPFEMQQQIFMFEATKQTKQQYQPAILSTRRHTA